MSDATQTIQSIRAFLAGTDQTANAQMAQAAVDYSVACQEVNDRLRRCVDFLRRGHRSEAIHLAEAAPNLIEMSTALDLPELSDWENLCAGYGWTRPVRIAVDSAQELNEAYAVERELTPLLSKHRRLALEEGTLPQRLEVLHQLSDADPLNPGWEQDVLDFEKARAIELKNEALIAIRAKDVYAAEKLLSELTVSSWRTEAAAEVSATLKDLVNRLNRDSAMIDAKSMLPSIFDAFNAMNVQECRRLVGRWDKLVHGYSLEPIPEMHAELHPVKQWLREQDEREVRRQEMLAICEALQRALISNYPIEEIQRLYRAARSFNVEMPEHIEQAYQDHMRSAKEDEKSRKQYLLWALIAVFVFVITGGFLLVRFVLKP